MSKFDPLHKLTLSPVCAIADDQAGSAPAVAYSTARLMSALDPLRTFAGLAISVVYPFLREKQMKTLSLIAFLTLPLAVPVSAQVAPDDRSLRQADATQMRIIVDEDAKAQRDFMHPNYIINGPSNRVMRKEQLVTMLAKGQMASEAFERTIEATSITANVGVVMGRETVAPSANSQLGKQFGGKVLSRRFTNVFLWERGKWRFLARQATVVPTP